MGAVLSAALGLGPARHQVLLFHRVLPQADALMPGEPTVEWFDGLVAWLAARYRIIPLAEAVQAARDGRLRGHSLSITFDDGYADNFLHALPVLQRHGAPATFFVAAGFLDGGCMWNDVVIETLRALAPGEYDLGDIQAGSLKLGDGDRLPQLRALIDSLKYRPQAERDAAVAFVAGLGGQVPADLMMRGEQVAELDAAAGMEVGGHTVTHPILARLSARQAFAEIEQGRNALTAIIGRPPRLFAYPNGRAGLDYLPEHVDMVRKAGFEAAVATDWGVLDRATDLCRIPRFTPWSRTYPRFGVDLFRGWLGAL